MSTISVMAEFAIAHMFAFAWSATVSRFTVWKEWPQPTLIAAAAVGLVMAITAYLYFIPPGRNDVLLGIGSGCAILVLLAHMYDRTLRTNLAEGAVVQAVVLLHAVVLCWAGIGLAAVIIAPAVLMAFNMLSRSLKQQRLREVSRAGLRDYFDQTPPASGG